ncbi:MAG: hypothetical protein ABIO70_06040 [Pseudomonadota bacterium]
MPAPARLVPVALALAVSCGQDYDIVPERPNVNPGEVTSCPFSPVAGTRFSAYDCNPVFSTTDEDWARSIGAVGYLVTEVLAHPFIQIWYIGASGNDYGMGYAISADGTDWETHPANPVFTQDVGAWDEDSVSAQVVVWDPVEGQYVMAYQGYSLGLASDPDDDIWGIGVTTSPDGVTWTKHPDNPVIDFGDYGLQVYDYWNYFCNERASDPVICDLIGWSYTEDYTLSSAIHPCWPLTMTMTDRGGFRGYLAAQDTLAILEGLDWEGFEEALWAGESAYVETDEYAACDVYRMDGIALDGWLLWEEEPVLVGAPGGPDGKGVTGAAVVDYLGVQYMFYLGFEEWIPGSGGLISADHSTLHIARSYDGGITWEKDPANPVPLHRTEDRQLWGVGAQVVGTRIYVWLSDIYDGGRAVGYFYYEPELEEVHPEEG